ANGIDQDPSLWQGADAPTQTSSNGQTTVTVKQDASKAILNWETFNVGRETTLHFDQTGGTQANGSNNWVALNRVLDPGASPSQILGTIKAEGSVYVINRNGIIFGGASQVNTHSFLASSLDLFSTDVNISNNTFLTRGIASGANGYALLVSGNPDLPDDQQPADRGAITIEAGAEIKTGANGFSLIAAPQLSNAGALTATDGQAILAAGAAVYLRTGNLQSQLLNLFIGQAGGPNAGHGAQPTRRLTNTGIVQATRGDVTLLGEAVDQDGIVAVTTGVTRPGSIHIDAMDGSNSVENQFPANLAGALIFGENSLTTILPSNDGLTTTSSDNASEVFKPGSISLRAGSVTLAGGSLIEAPGATLTIQSNYTNPQTEGDSQVQGRVYLDSGATIDVSGLADVQLALDSTRVT
ncbi:MAG: filamentous hemagglutinin N-terminal domain-containing protein, partial [Bradyrhizobium sp.]